MDNNYQFDMDKTREKIQEMRKAAGFKTQQQLADAAGIALNSVSRYEKENPRTPKVDAFALIANALRAECDADYLLGLQEHPKKTTSEISKLVPLERESILTLESLKELINKDAPFAYADGYAGYTEEDASFIAGLIDWFIRGLCWRIDNKSLLDAIIDYKSTVEYMHNFVDDGFRTKRDILDESNQIKGDIFTARAALLSEESARSELGKVFGTFMFSYIQRYLNSSNTGSEEV